MKKYYIVSDIHSCYSELMEALDKEGFDKDNPSDILVVCGDLFDRGEESLELYNFIKSLPEDRCILILGNHEDLFTALVDKQYIQSHDISNGTVKTLYTLAGKLDLYKELYESYDYLFLKQISTARVIEDIGKQREESFKKILKNKKVKEVYNWIKSDRWINYYEGNNYIFVHSFIPVMMNSNDYLWTGYIDSKYCEYIDTWRDCSKEAWETFEARWGNPLELALAGLNKTGKYIVCGHWHTSYFYKRTQKENEHLVFKDKDGNFISIEDCPIYRNNDVKLIGLDTCTVKTRRVNVLVLGEDEI